MPWIQQISIDEATGLLKGQFDAALQRAGRVWHIVHIMSLNPEAMEASLRLYQVLMFREGPLTRIQRELLATVGLFLLNAGPRPGPPGRGREGHERGAGRFLRPRRGP